MCASRDSCRSASRRSRSKTGTIGGIRNDCGIITLAEDNHVILSCFTEWDEAPIWNQPVAHHRRVFEVETAMGEIGRAVYSMPSPPTND